MMLLETLRIGALLLISFSVGFVIITKCIENKITREEIETRISRHNPPPQRLHLTSMTSPQ